MRRTLGLGCLGAAALLAVRVAWIGPGNVYLLGWLADKFGPTIAKNAIGLGPWEDGEATIVAVDRDMTDRFRTQGTVTLAYTDEMGARRIVEGRMVRFMNTPDEEMPKVGDAETIYFCKADPAIMRAARFVIEGASACEALSGGG